MIRFLSAYLAMIGIIIVGDAVWLGLVAQPLYQQAIGHLMADQPNLVAAALFYLIYPAGLLYVVVAPNAGPAAWPATLSAAAIFGLVAYATYDLTNLATLKDWPVFLACVDIAWGTTISMASAAGGRAVLNRMSVT
jgi:uncharacterized membrane protein